MTGFRSGPVRVEVPATSANLGPGFDSLGLALELRDELEAEVTSGGLSVEVEGAGADTVPRDEQHLVVRSVRAGFEALGHAQPGLRLRCRNRIPHARGLGSSSAAIVGGLALARALAPDGDRLDDDALLQVAADLEGHPDNVAPALLGGFVVAGREAGRWFAVPGEVDGSVRAEAFIPAEHVETSVARGLLPDSVPHAAAAANAGRAALLVTALAGRPEHLWAATLDHLHQEYRRPAMPASMDLVDRLRSEGRAALISGAGPTVLVLGVEGHEALADRCPPGWTHHRMRIATEGVRVVAG